MEYYHWGGSTTRVVGVGTAPPLLSMFTAASLAMSLNLDVNLASTGCFFNWYPPKKLKYGKPRLGESMLT